MFRKFYYRLLRKFNDDIPTRTEVEYNLDIKHKLNSQIYLAMFRYSCGQEIEEIADRLNITRERVRQYLLKGCRDEL